LVPTVATLGEGIDLALANKESLVVGGELVMALAEATGAAIIPVDSEHSALHQLLGSERPGTVERLIITASGGPFRGRGAAELEDVTVEQALAHPTWEMGGKITIDSATLMNKGLEVIEAHHLFGVAYEKIDVVVHPQSLIHSLIQLCDGATLAHLGYPDMRVPISYALNYPDRIDVPVRPLDLVEVGALTFEQVDDQTFACLRLAREAALAGGTGALQPYFPTGAFPGPIGQQTNIGLNLPTPFVSYPQLYTASCEDSGGASWLQINDVGASSDTRPRVADRLGPTWGLHLADVNLALGNLVSVVGRQAAMYRP